MHSSVRFAQWVNTSQTHGWTASRAHNTSEKANLLAQGMTSLPLCGKYGSSSVPSWQSERNVMSVWIASSTYSVTSYYHLFHHKRLPRSSICRHRTRKSAGRIRADIRPRDLRSALWCHKATLSAKLFILLRHISWQNSFHDRTCRSMHVLLTSFAALLHGTDDVVVFKYDITTSSLPSEQSMFPSQKAEAEMHSPFSQMNLDQ